MTHQVLLNVKIYTLNGSIELLASLDAKAWPGYSHGIQAWIWAALFLGLRQYWLILAGHKELRYQWEGWLADHSSGWAPAERHISNIISFA